MVDNTKSDSTSSSFFADESFELSASIIQQYGGARASVATSSSDDLVDEVIGDEQDARMVITLEASKEYQAITHQAEQEFSVLNAWLQVSGKLLKEQQSERNKVHSEEQHKWTTLHRELLTEKKPMVAEAITQALVKLQEEEGPFRQRHKEEEMQHRAALHKLQGKWNEVMYQFQEDRNNFFEEEMLARKEIHDGGISILNKLYYIRKDLQNVQEREVIERDQLIETEETKRRKKIEAWDTEGLKMKLRYLPRYMVYPMKPQFSPPEQKQRKYPWNPGTHPANVPKKLFSTYVHDNTLEEDDILSRRRKKGKSPKTKVKGASERLYPTELSEAYKMRGKAPKPPAWDSSKALKKNGIDKLLSRIYDSPLQKKVDEQNRLENVHYKKDAPHFVSVRRQKACVNRLHGEAMYLKQEAAYQLTLKYTPSHVVRSKQYQAPTPPPLPPYLQLGGKGNQHRKEYNGGNWWSTADIPGVRFHHVAAPSEHDKSGDSLQEIDEPEEYDGDTSVEHKEEAVDPWTIPPLPPPASLKPVHRVLYEQRLKKEQKKKTGEKRRRLEADKVGTTDHTQQHDGNTTTQQQQQQRQEEKKHNTTQPHAAAYTSSPSHSHSFNASHSHSFNASHSIARSHSNLSSGSQQADQQQQRHTPTPPGKVKTPSPSLSRSSSRGATPISPSNDTMSNGGIEGEKETSPTIASITRPHNNDNSNDNEGEGKDMEKEKVTENDANTKLPPDILEPQEPPDDSNHEDYQKGELQEERKDTAEEATNGQQDQGDENAAAPPPEEGAENANAGKGDTPKEEHAVSENNEGTARSDGS